MDEWMWHHEGTDKTITLRRDHHEWRAPGQVAHLLREAWRFYNFQEFMKGDRRATAACNDAQYDPPRYKRMLKIVEELPAAARIFAGAVVSPAHYHKGDLVLGECPWCTRALGTWEHVAWECPGRRFRHRPQQQPNDGLQRRLLRPTALPGRKQVDRQLVEWAVFVDRVIRDHRYDDDGRPPRGARSRG